MPPFLDRKNRALLLGILFGGSVMALALGIRHVQGLFLLPMTLDRGWGRELFSFAMAVQNMVWGLAQPFTGMVADRFGSKHVVAVGTLLYAGGLVLMTNASTGWELVLSAGVLIGLALSCTAFGVIYGCISRIAPAELRSASVGLTGAIGGAGLFLLVPITQDLQSSVGWSAALLLMAAAIALLFPGALVLNDAQYRTSNTGGSGVSMKSAVWEAFAHRGFWLLNLGFLACGFQLAFIAGHLPAYLLDQGLDVRHAVVGLAVVGLTNVAGTYVCGWLGGRYRPKYLLGVLYLARTVFMALFLLLPLTPGSVYLFCGAMGFLWLGTVPLTSGVLAGVFGVQYISTLFGFVFFGHQLGGFLGVWLGGYVFDWYGSYNYVWACSMLIGVIASALHLLINDEPVDRKVQLQAT